MRPHGATWWAAVFFTAFETPDVVANKISDRDADLIREAVVRYEVKKSQSPFCVIVRDEQGLVAPSAWLMARVRRRYPKAGAYPDSCYIPEVLVGPIEAVHDGQVQIFVGLPEGIHGTRRVQVRKNWLGHWCVLDLVYIRE